MLANSTPVLRQLFVIHLYQVAGVVSILPTPQDSQQELATTPDTRYVGTLHVCNPGM
jgi:hypothetical protein